MRRIFFNCLAQQYLVVIFTSNKSVKLSEDQRDRQPGQPDRQGEQREIPDCGGLRPVLLPPPEDGGEAGDEEEEVKNSPNSKVQQMKNFSNSKVEKVKKFSKR